MSGSKPNVSYRADLIFFMNIEFLINEWLLCSLWHICVYICIFLYTAVYFVQSTKHSMEVNESFIRDRLLYVPLGHPVLAAACRKERQSSKDWILSGRETPSKCISAGYCCGLQLSVRVSTAMRIIFGVHYSPVHFLGKFVHSPYLSKLVWPDLS